MPDAGDELERAKARWQLIFFHEAGHAVASLVLWDYSADITAEFPEGAEQSKATFNHTLRHEEIGINPFHCVVRLAAGAEAERVTSGVEKSEGFKKDLGQIMNCLNLAKGWLHLLVGRGDEGAKAYGDIVTQAEAEVQTGYPETQRLIVQYEAAVRAIGEAAYQRFIAQVPDGILEHFPQRVVLTADEVRSLFNERRASTAGDAGMPQTG